MRSFIEKSLHIRKSAVSTNYYLILDRPLEAGCYRIQIPVVTPPQSEIIKVIFNPPATIVFWKDGTKTVVKCSENDIFDPEKGLAMAICKKVFGNQGDYYKNFSKWLPEPVETGIQEFDPDIFSTFCDVLERTVERVSGIPREMFTGKKGADDQ